MKLRYKHQRFQTEAALAVANAFTGQPKSDGLSDHIVDQGVNQDLFVVKGFGNKNVILAPEAVCENVRAIQTEQGRYLRLAAAAAARRRYRPHHRNGDGYG